MFATKNGDFFTNTHEALSEMKWRLSHWPTPASLAEIAVAGHAGLREVLKLHQPEKWFHSSTKCRECSGLFSPVSYPCATVSEINLVLGVKPEELMKSQRS